MCVCVRRVVCAVLIQGVLHLILFHPQLKSGSERCRGETQTLFYEQRVKERNATFFQHVDAVVALSGSH